MSQQELLKKLAACLERTGIPYMITGSIASSLHGEPRSTHDIDVGTMFNLIDSLEPEEIFGTRLFVSSPEDTIIAKLRWARLSGGSEKQFGEALHVYEVQHQGLDFPYLEQWVTDLGLSDLWERLKGEAQAI